MSLSLLKRSLQIVEEDIDVGARQDKKKKKAAPNSKSTKGREDKGSIINLIPENQRLTVYERDHKSKGKRE